MRILHVAETAKGGVGSYIDEVAAMQVAELGAGSVKAIVPDAHAAQLGRIPATALSPFRRTGRNARSLARLHRVLHAEIRAFAPDIVHAHSFFAGLVARTALGGLQGGPALLYCPHGWAFDIAAPRWQQRLLEHMERALSRRCAGIVAISEHEARRARAIGIDGGKIRPVPNGISVAPPPAVPASWDDGRLKILFVGRLDRQKGFDILLAAVDDAPERFSVKVVGDAVANAAVPTRLPAHVGLLGWCDRGMIEGLLQQADVLAMPSRWEGFGLTALEAMRAGKPVVATRVGGLGEVVEDGVTGRLVPPDDPAALRRALLADDEDGRARLGRNGRRRFLERFTAERTHRLLLDLYDELRRTRDARVEAPRGRRSEAPAAARRTAADAPF